MKKKKKHLKLLSIDQDHNQKTKIKQRPKLFQVQVIKKIPRQRKKNI